MQIRTSEDIKKLGTILGVWAHPDDESFTMAAIMACAFRNGQKVACVTATRGEAGIQDESRWPAEKLGQIREQELNVCMKILGDIDHHWLDYEDGRCEQAKTDDAVEVLTKLIEEIKPDSILTFGPEGLTGHPDHATVSVWTDQAVSNMTGQKPNIYHAVLTQERYQEIVGEKGDEHNIFFNIDKPPTCEPNKCNILYNPPADIMEIKFQALKAQASQTAIMIEGMGESRFKKSMGEEAFIRVR